MPHSPVLFLKGETERAFGTPFRISPTRRVTSAAQQQEGEAERMLSYVGFSRPTQGGEASAAVGEETTVTVRRAATAVSWGWIIVLH